MSFEGSLLNKGRTELFSHDHQQVSSVLVNHILSTLSNLHIGSITGYDLQPTDGDDPSAYTIALPTLPTSRDPTADEQDNFNALLSLQKTPRDTLVIEGFPPGGIQQTIHLHGTPYHLTSMTVCQNGHYVAFCKTGAQWYRCDDLIVSPAPTREIDFLLEVASSSDAITIDTLIFSKGSEKKDLVS